MTYIAKKTLQYQTRPGVLFDLVEGEEAGANGFDLEELIRAGVVKKKNLIDTVKEKLSKKQEETEAEEIMIAREEAEEAPKKRGRPKKTELLNSEL